MKQKDEFYGGAAFVGNDYFHPTLLGKLPIGKLVCNDIIVRVNGETVFDVNEMKPTCSFNLVIGKMRSTGPGESLDLDVLRLSSQPINRRIRVSKLLPKYAGSSSNVTFTPDLLGFIRDKVIDDACGPEASSSLSKSDLSIDAEDVPSDPFSTNLTVAGWSDLVESTKVVVTDVLHSQIICHKQNAMLQAKDNIELDLRLDPGTKMGVYLDDFRHTYMYHLPHMRRSTRGVWFTLQSGVSQEGQMSSILGQATALGGVILKIGERSVDSIDDATNAWRSLKDKSEVIVTVCIHKDSDTRSINRFNLVREPRRRGGGAYRGPLHVPPASNVDTIPSCGSNTKRKRKLSDGNTSNGRRKQKVASDADDDGSGGREISNVSLHANEYQRFRAKISRIFDIEFKAHGFQKTAVIKSAWSLHKSLIGDTCDDNCSCPSRLRDICANIVKEHLKKKQEEEGVQWKNPLNLRPNEFPIGFISRFVPKFIIGVEKEMPGSNSTEVLDMLIQMWGKHKKASCSSSCTCQDDWERVFKPKVVHAMKTNTARNSISGSQPPMVGREIPNEVSPTAAAHDTQEVTGKSRSPSPSSEPNIIRKIGTSSSIVSHSSGGTRNSAIGAKSASSLGSLLHESVEKPFVVTFDTIGLNKPLGLFFITDRKRKNGNDDDTVCKVASICPYYSGKRQNAKIKVGTFVVGTAPNYRASKGTPAMERLNSHEALKERYAAACGDELIESLDVWFVNSDTMPASVSNAVVAGKRDWATSGEWLGRSKVAGWAGGAATKGSGSAKKSNSNSSKAAAGEKGGEATNRRDGTKNSPVDLDHLTASSTNATEEKRSRSVTGSLLLLPDRERKTGRKVSFFKGSHDVKEYVIGSSVTGKIVENSSHERGNDFNMMKAIGSSMQNQSLSIDCDDEATPASPTKGAALDMDVPINVRRNKKLLEAILDGDYRDVLRLLKEGAPVSMRDKNNLAPIDHIKKKIVALESQLREAGSADKPALQNSLTDFKRKSILLKIYIHVDHNISLLCCIDDWQNIQIAVDSINGLSLSGEGREHPSSEYVFCVMVLENR